MSKDATIIIEIPVGTVPAGGYHSPRFDGHLSPEEAQALASIKAGLVGKTILLRPLGTGAAARPLNPNSTTDVIRYLLQQVADERKAG